MPSRLGASCLLPLQGLVDRFLECAERLSTLEQLAVDQKGRRGPDAIGLGAGHILLDAIRIFAGVKTFVEGGAIEAERIGVLLQLVLRKVTDILTRPVREERIVILPEFSLIAGAIGSLGRVRGF